MKYRISAFYKAAFILFVAFFLSFSGKAQGLVHFEHRWKQGTLVLTNGDTLQGHTSIMLPNDIVRLTMADGAMATFLPGEIRMLEVREPHGKTGDKFQDRRKYGQFLWNHDNDYGKFKSPALFVVVTPGRFSLLMREERHKQSTAMSGSRPFVESMVKIGAEQIVYEKFYLQTPNRQEVKLLRDPKNDLLSFFPDKKKMILKYAKENDLGFKKIEELALIVAFCNTL